LPNTASGLWYPDSSHDVNISAIVQQAQESVDTVMATQRPTIQDGAMDIKSFMVTQRVAGGANMSVDVASDYGAGAQAGAYVRDSSGRFVFVPKTVALTNLAIASNASGNPRIDSVALSSSGTIAVYPGTPTAGATISNASTHGGAILPSGVLRLAEILVASGAATITNSVIRDRRTFARGAYRRVFRNQNAAAGFDYTTATGVFALIDSVNLAPRIECSGVPLRVTLVGTLSHSTTADGLFSPQVDGVGVNGMPSVGASTAGGQAVGFNSAAAVNRAVTLTWEFTPGAGSFIIAPAWASTAGTLTINAKTSRPLLWIIEEILRPDADNNTFTTG
jgi:hypothetical protein